MSEEQHKTDETTEEQHTNVEQTEKTTSEAVESKESSRPRKVLKPKPYTFVPFPSGRMQRNRPPGHHVFKENHLSGSFVLTITVKTPLHINRGKNVLGSEEESVPLKRGHFKTQDKLAIPSTTLKGMIRTIIETIAHCGLTKFPLWKIQAIPQNALPPRPEQANRLKKLDLAEQIFGTMGYLGQIQFMDALMIEGGTEIVRIPVLHTPHTDDQIYENEKKELKGRKFYRHGKPTENGHIPVEACRVGSVFRSQVYFSNLTKGQLGLLFFAFQLTAKIGSGKPACFGSVDFKVSDIRQVNPSKSYLEYDVEPEHLDDSSMADFMRAALASSYLIEDAFSLLNNDIWKYPENNQLTELTECPGDSY